MLRRTAIPPTKILIVGQDPELLELYSEILGEEDFATATMREIGDDAMTVVQHAPDLILLDGTLGPSHWAWQMLQRLQSWEATASIPVLVCTTATCDIERWKAYFQAKRVGVLLKPFETDDLVDTICEMVRPRSAVLASPVTFTRQPFLWE